MEGKPYEQEVQVDILNTKSLTDKNSISIGIITLNIADDGMLSILNVERTTNMTIISNKIKV